MLRKFLLTVTLCSLVGCSFGVGGKTTRYESYKPDNDLLKETTKFTAEEEGTIGRAVAAKLLSNYPLLSNQKIDQYLDSIGETLVGVSTRKTTFYGFFFRVLDTDQINAISAPGGLIFISKGFLKLIPNEDVLAAVLAHEIAHVNKLHGLHAIKPNHTGDYTNVGGKLVSAIDCSGVASQTLAAFDGAINDIVDKLITSGYSKEQEYDADLEALILLREAGYDPKALQIALEILGKNKEGAKKGSGWFATHPSPESRIKNIGSFEASNQAELGKEIRDKRFKLALAGLS